VSPVFLWTVGLCYWQPHVPAPVTSDFSAAFDGCVEVPLVLDDCWWVAAWVPPFVAGRSLGEGCERTALADV
jgi:hypothetical protein